VTPFTPKVSIVQIAMALSRADMRL
jgi:hypothetical protein